MQATAGEFDNEAACWAAVASRDKQADGQFFYSVATTGIYCRPSCPSRSARRENVAFHPTATAAEAAGFRACKRCRPNERPQREAHAEAVARACRMMDEAEDSPSLEQLADAAGMSRFHFHRVFKSVAGVTPKAYAAARRRERVQRALEGGASVTAAIYEAGFNTSSRFYEGVEARLGMAPAAYRNGGVGNIVRFAVGECSLGSILVAATDKGVCAILLGDDPEALAHDLQDRFPRARLVGGDADFEATVAMAVGLVERPGMPNPLPLDVRGTAFQQRVWQVLQDVAPGTTVSYAEVARRLGEPRATRAVAQACGANHLAVAIPCHRVVRADGGLSGYRWGVERKRELLARESEAA